MCFSLVWMLLGSLTSSPAHATSLPSESAVEAGARTSTSEPLSLRKFQVCSAVLHISAGDAGTDDRTNHSEDPAGLSDERVGLRARLSLQLLKIARNCHTLAR